MKRRQFLRQTGSGLAMNLLAGACSDKAVSENEEPATGDNSSKQHAPQSSKQEFRPFESLIFPSNMPDFTDVGLEHVKIVYANEMWRQGVDMTEPDEIQVRAAAQKLVDIGTPICLDIEHWSLTGSEETVTANIARYIAVVDLMRDERPELDFGYYGTLPVRNYWAPVGNNGMDEWRKQNERLMQLADHVDVVFPSIYTFYENQDGWETYAKANIEQARMYNKPVYPFLWPEYHPSNAALAGTDVTGDYWSRQLEVCKNFADGLVIWGGWQRDWDDNAPWWQATIEFMSRLAGPTLVE